MKYTSTAPVTPCPCCAALPYLDTPRVRIMIHEPGCEIGAAVDRSVADDVAWLVANGANVRRREITAAESIDVATTYSVSGWPVGEIEIERVGRDLIVGFEHLTIVPVPNAAVLRRWSA